MPEGPPDDLEIDAFESSLDEMLERVSSSTRAEQEAREREWPAPAKRAPASRVEPTPTPKAASTPRAAMAPHPPPSPMASMAGDRSPGPRRLAWGVFALVALGVVMAWSGWRFDAPPAPPSAFEKLPPPGAGPVLKSPSPRARGAATSDPAVQARSAALPPIASDPDASTEAVMLDELREGRATTAAAGATSFAIARYDSLPPASGAWNVLVPLGVEEVYALVPATSRLRELDDLRGRRINVGATGSARARSAEALYRTLFGQPLPPAPLRAAAKDDALPALLRGEGLDAMLLFDGQPSSWLNRLPVETRLQLKVLRLNPAGSSGKRALQSYLATSVTPTLASEPAPVPTLGQVTFLVASRGQAGSPELVRRLCERLPALQASGHPKWKDVDLALQLPLRLPRSPDIASAVNACSPLRRPLSPSSGALS